MKQLPVHILGIAPYEGMATAMERAAKDYSNIHLDVFTGNLDTGVAIVQAHKDDAYDCIISRGGTAEAIRRITDIPVVEISLTVYDVLRSIKLAENYADRYAIVGFPSITEPAHILCDLLRYQLDIFTVHSTADIYSTLTQLQQGGYRMVIGDMETHIVAQEIGIDAFLITSGSESFHAAFHQAVTMSAGFRRLRQENTFLSCIMKDSAGSIVVLDTHGDLYYADPLEPQADLLTLLRTKLLEIPTSTTLKFYYNQRGTLYNISAQILRMGTAKYYLFHYITAHIPLRSGKSGIRSFSKSECEYLFNASFYKISGALGDLENRINSIALTRQPVMILGEVGTGKEQIARLLYLRSPGSNRPFVVIDCALTNDKSWDFLLNHYNSPLNDSGNTVYFHNMECITSSQSAEVLALILSSDLTSRIRLIFSCSTSENGNLPCTITDIIRRTSSLSLVLPTLRSREDEIPSLASFYLNSLNLEMGKQISGFDAHAMDQLRRFSWPNNYTQFIRVLQELATITDSFYIRSSTVAEVLAWEHAAAAQPHHPNTAVQEGLTLDQIIRSAIEQALIANNGNQTAAAKQLGIGRTTMWRHLNQSSSRKLT